MSEIILTGRKTQIKKKKKKKKEKNTVRQIFETPFLCNFKKEIQPLFYFT